VHYGRNLKKFSKRHPVFKAEDEGSGSSEFGKFLPGYT
jgi:hypothetical protein